MIYSARHCGIIDAQCTKTAKAIMQNAFLLLADKYIKCITTSSSHYLVKSHFKVLIVIISIIMLILK